MPLELTPRNLSHPHRAKYLQLADVVSMLITDGHLQPQEKLPSEGRLAEMVGVSKAVVREAFDRLERDGQIRRRNGVPAEVAPRDKVRVMKVDRYVQEDRSIRGDRKPTSSAFTRDHHIDWDKYTIELEIKREPATPTDKVLLRLPYDPKGSMVWRRYFLKYAAGEPVEIQRSAISIETAEQCPWMVDRGTQPYPGGTQRELADGGLRVTEVKHKVRARMPTEQEKGDLQIPEIPVFEIERVFYSGSTPVEASRVIVDARRHELEFGVQLPDATD